MSEFTAVPHIAPIQTPTNEYLAFELPGCAKFCTINGIPVTPHMLNQSYQFYAEDLKRHYADNGIAGDYTRRLRDGMDTVVITALELCQRNHLNHADLSQDIVNEMRGVYQKYFVVREDRPDQAWCGEYLPAPEIPAPFALPPSRYPATISKKAAHYLHNGLGDWYRNLGLVPEFMQTPTNLYEQYGAFVVQNGQTNVPAFPASLHAYGLATLFGGENHDYALVLRASVHMCDYLAPLFNYTRSLARKPGRPPAHRTGDAGKAFEEMTMATLRLREAQDTVQRMKDDMAPYVEEVARLRALIKQLKTRC